MSVSDVFLDAGFKCFHNFSITHTFHPALDYVKKQAYICESLGACSRYSGHVVSGVIHVTNSPLPVDGQSSVC
jgi:hypothetical protein